MKFNINDYVKVKLTQRGIDILKKQHEELKERFPRLSEFKKPQVDKDGYSQFQMWSLMKHFGNNFHLGCELPFEAEIIISEGKS